MPARWVLAYNAKWKCVIFHTNAGAHTQLTKFAAWINRSSTNYPASAIAMKRDSTKTTPTIYQSNQDRFSSSIFNILPKCNHDKAPLPLPPQYNPEPTDRTECELVQKRRTKNRIINWNKKVMDKIYWIKRPKTKRLSKWNGIKWDDDDDDDEDDNGAKEEENNFFFVRLV